MKYQLVVFTVLFLGLLGINSRSAELYDSLDEPVVGMKCPDFNFKTIDFYIKKEGGLGDFKGKWLVLDFWSKYCSSCIGSFPVVSEEQEKLRDRVQIIMVTYLDSKNENRDIFNQYHARLRLKMPCAYVDSSFFDKWNVGLLPHTVIVDPDGVVRAVTIKPSVEKLEKLIAGENPKFDIASYADGKEKRLQDSYGYSPGLPFLTEQNGGEDTLFYFRSLLAKWNPHMPIFMNKEMIHSDRTNLLYHDVGRFEVIGYGISHLYFCAYTGYRDIARDDTTLYGRMWPEVIFEIADSDRVKVDHATGENVYCYSLSVPSSKAEKKFMMQLMQNDLRNYFGYKADLENREMPCWYLTLKDIGMLNKLRSTGGKEEIDVIKAWSKVSYRNISLFDFMGVVRSALDLEAHGAPLLNATGLDSSVLINVTASFYKNDVDGLIKELNKFGLDLVKGKRLMRVIVVRDAD